MTARPIRRNAQTPDRNGKIFYTSTTSLSHISKGCRIVLDGTGMLLWQGNAAFHIFTGKQMPTEEVYEKFFR